MTEINEFWIAVFMAALTTSFFLVGTVLMLNFDNGFIFTITIILYICGIVGIIFVFTALFELFEKM
jgi:hypothetical protein